MPSPRIKMPGIKSQIQKQPGLWFSVSCSTSGGLNFSIYKMGLIIIPTPQGKRWGDIR